jgi:hypothetical protein
VLGWGLALGFALLPVYAFVAKPKGDPLAEVKNEMMLMLKK